MYKERENSFALCLNLFFSHFILRCYEPNQEVNLCLWFSITFAVSFCFIDCFFVANVRTNHKEFSLFQTNFNFIFSLENSVRFILAAIEPVHKSRILSSSVFVRLFISSLQLVLNFKVKQTSACEWQHKLEKKNKLENCHRTEKDEMKLERRKKTHFNDENKQHFENDFDRHDKQVNRQCNWVLEATDIARMP